MDTPSDLHPIDYSEGSFEDRDVMMEIAVAQGASNADDHAGMPERHTENPVSKANISPQPQFVNFHNNQANAQEETGFISCTMSESQCTPDEKSQLLDPAHAVLNRSSGDLETRHQDDGDSIWHVWWLEILSSLLAFACLGAIIVILLLHQGKTLPDWPKFISVNSLVSIFTAVFKGSLIMPVAEGIGQLKWDWFRRPQKLADINMFDNASRGPWGSLIMIITRATSLNEGYLAGLGAFITIAALAVDPFSQAMVELRPCDNAASFGLAEVPRTNNFSGTETDILSDQRVQTIYNALSSPRQTAELLDVKCTSGNSSYCIFEDPKASDQQDTSQVFHLGHPSLDI
ncbi:hypothetical protein CcaCcLH18_11320 [Colletotrichum camelliae]|nr:hypothetical protein CcaCcLH18_11320 [Colletotrichum camelliae]